MMDEASVVPADDRSGDRLPDRNLFMMCRRLNPDALRGLPAGYHIRHCRKDELERWKAMPFDDPGAANTNHEYMTRWFERVYAPKGELFYRTCLFVCDQHDTPIATGFVWHAYDAFNTIHWLKVLLGYEGRGIGRALLAHMLARLGSRDYPVYLHTQPESYRAIKLYSDFGFSFLTDPVIGTRTNHLEACLPFLSRHMRAADYRRLSTTRAPKEFLETLKTEEEPEF